MRDVALLLKFRLAFTVVFSAVAGYLLGAPEVDAFHLITLTIGGFAIVASSNAFNQLWEIERDALMDRTKNRPLPTGRMSRVAGFAWAIGLGLVGTIALSMLNAVTAGFGLLSMLLYVLVYTPMKAKSPWSVLVGAFPGAIPFLLGWVSVTGDFGIEPGVLFGIQFLWQFPHFWAIAWLGYDDYAKAGYFLLPTRKKDSTATHMSVVYTLWMIFFSLLPAFGVTGTLELSSVAAVLVFLLGIDVLRLAVTHHRKPSDACAKALMFGTIRYLPLLQLVYVIDHFIS
ncbi:MAG: protoheme IX farnesyltransferase [Flavobacteriales bacterium]|nr:protoheme IX farnesyltransferase [Flavobacteriales bacterium]